MPMRKERWREELAAAASEKDVVNVVRDYIALLSHDELSTLPGNARPGLVRSGEDIAGWAVNLVRSQLASIAQSEGVDVMRDMSEFFAAAAAKITEIRIGGAERPVVG